MRLFIGSIIALCLAWVAPCATAQDEEFRPVRLVSVGEPVFEHVDRMRGLQSTNIFDIATDPHGFVWLAGDHGVHRYDGHNFFNLDRDPARHDTLESRYVYLMSPSRDGVFIISPHANLQVLDSTTGKLRSVAVRGASLKDIYWLACDANSRLWYVNNEGLVRLDRSGEAIQVLRAGVTVNFSKDRTSIFAVTRDHILKIDTNDPGKISNQLDLPAGFPSSVTALTADGNGLWLLADRKIWRADWKTRSVRHVAMPLPFPAIVPTMVQSDDGVLWFGTIDEGLWRFDPQRGTLSVIKHDPHNPQSLPINMITSLAVDRSNNLWLGLGLYGLGRLRLNQTTPAHYRIKGGQSVCSISEIDRDRLLVGLCPGGIREVDRASGQLKELPSSTPLPQRSRAMVGDGKGGAWITSLREGLIHWQPDGTVRRWLVEDRPDIPEILMSGVHVDDKQRVWVSYLRGLAVLEPGSNTLRSVEGNKFYIVNDVSGGPHGSLWLGTVSGLVNYDPATRRIRRYAHDKNDRNTLSDNDVVQTYTDHGGRLWVGTRAGLNRMIADRNGRTVFKRYDRNDGLPDITIASIINDAQGGLWVGTYRGLAKWDPKADRFQSYLPADGVPDSDIYPKAATLSADGSLYFGTWMGLWHIDPKGIRISDPVPVVLSSYEVGDKATINLSGKGLSAIRAKYSDSRVAFRIAVLGDARRLSYRLDGLEDTWRDMPDDLNISYYRLPPGNYRLQIRQLQRGGTWGAPDLSLPIEITPPLWRTGWAYALYSILAIALLFGLARAFLAWKQRALREQLKESNARLSVALQAAGFGMWAWDVNKDEADLDAHAKEILAIPSGAPPVADVFSRMHPEDLERVREQINRALQEGAPVNFEFRLADGHSIDRWRWIEGHAIPYRRPGKSAYVIGVNRDATQRKHELIELEESREEAQRATESKGRFLAMMSHEIRTPINGVIGMVELLFETPMSEEQQQLLGICKDSAYVLLTIINDILDFSKIEAGKLRLEYTALSPRRLVESVGESLRTQVAEKGIDLDVFVDHDVPRRLLGDRVRVRQILTNLVGNAVKFTGKGGVRVYVSAKRASNGNAHRHLIRFDVIDTGIGMDRRTLDSLFQPFQQADAATTRRFGGTGLGLTIVKHLVEMMGGHVECDSAIALGSRFSAVIPMESIGVDGKKAPLFPGLSILALCESPERTVLLRELGADIGVKIDVASSLEPLLQWVDEGEAKGTQHRLVLLDKGFVKDHDALCHAIRQHPAATTIPIIAVRADHLRTTPASASGVTVVAGSPLTSGSLLRGIQLALGLASPVIPAIAAESVGASMSRLPAPATILLAEDNATNREVITRQLQRLGYACDVAEDGEQAWHLLQAHPGRYQLLLTDCHMPRLDGYGLAERIRRDEAASGRPRLNIVAITANALLGEGERCLTMGMDAYLAKPLHMSDLKRVLARMLPGTLGPIALEERDGVQVEDRSEFPALARITGNDEAKLQRLLDIFVSSTLADLERWNLARDAHDHDTLRKLAHKLKSGCLQLGENAVASAFEAVEQHAGTTAELEALADFAVFEMQRILERIAAVRRRSLMTRS